MQLPALTEGILIKRYKRFLADVDFGGTVETVHCPNPGAMTGLKDPGSRVWCSTSDNPKRKLKKTLELVESGGVLVGINTNLPNKLVQEALTEKIIPAFAPYPEITPEFTYTKGTRFDFRVAAPDGRAMMIEVKNVHLARPDGPNPGAMEFPDSVTARGAKHLRTLAEIARRGEPAAMLYVIQRGDGEYFTLADDIDPAYAEAYIDAHEAGVEMHAWRCDITTSAITITEPVSINYGG
ncbi:MAG: DNA/RNA nuclease SfsA [Alphaproteobacteria bacterium]|nr:DNA/RNA nuclease SfsA [Alphaproteobacteria bacterium]